MTDKKEEWEIGYSKEHPPIESEAIAADFQKSETLVGQMLDGRFLIEQDLTEGGADAGGIGLVYLAKDMKLMGKQTVVKILQKARLKNEDIVRKFQHEKEALIRLDHPNIVRILDSGTLSDGNPFMVMEYIEGYSLRRKLRETGKLPLAECAHLIESVTDALDAAHAKKVLHRDIKPENIMLTPSGDELERVRLIDFGIARVEDSQLAPATTIPRGIGTILYIAPEQLAGKLEQTPAVDIYSFAIVIYEMLTGKLPFEPKSMIEMFELQKNGVQTKPRELRADISAEAEQLILQALSFEPTERPPEARKFGKDLATALRQQENLEPPKVQPKPLAPTEPSPLPNFSEFKIPDVAGGKKRKSKTPVYLALGFLVLAAVGSLLGFVYWKSSPATENSNAVANIEKTSESPRRELAYFLNVQKMRDGKPFEEPFKSSGQEIFENGYKFKLNIKSDAAGFIYLFNEDKDAPGNTIYNILYPTPKTNNGSADIKAKEQIETSYNTFGGTRGTEIVWLIWTKDKTDDLESARTSAFDGQGTVKDEKNVGKITDFVQKYSKEKVETNKDTANQQTVVKGRGDVVVSRIELEHR